MMTEEDKRLKEMLIRKRRDIVRLAWQQNRDNILKDAISEAQKRFGTTPLSDWQVMDQVDKKMQAEKERRIKWITNAREINAQLGIKGDQRRLWEDDSEVED